MISNELLGLIIEITGDKPKALDAVEKLTALVNKFKDKNSALLQVREDLQKQIDEFFIANKGRDVSVTEVVTKLKEIGYIKTSNSNDKLPTTNYQLPSEIAPLAGPQLVVPADKANMVLNAANARWGSLYNALYASNIIDLAIKDDNLRQDAVRKYTNDFLDKIVQFDGAGWNDVVGFSVDRESFAVDNKLVAITKDNKQVSLNAESQEKLIGINFDEYSIISDFILENNGLKIEIKLNNENIAKNPLALIKDILLESALTYIIDLEDASISAPQNKIESYRNLLGIQNGTLSCEVRGKTRVMAKDTTYLDAKTLEIRTLKRTALPLVRDVGPHMVADTSMIEIDGQEVPEKIVDCFITSLIGMRHHVAPKMHGADEVKFNVELWDEINKAQGLPENANKIGIMIEEMRSSAQLQNCIEEAKDIIFFTNTGFLDYTGSFIDLMMYAGAIAPYSILPAQTYKTEYEKHNVNVSLRKNVPQIGAGMWAETQNMVGLLKSKEGQVRGLTDTGWSPSPSAATIHAIAFHIFGNVRDMQKEYAKNIKDVDIKDLFAFPKADLAQLTQQDKEKNLDLAIHGLLAYAEPWVRRGIGCSAIMDMNNVYLMEDRATARIKAAFVRNWLLHDVVTEKQVKASIARMAKYIDGQNEANADYKPLYTNILEGDYAINSDKIDGVINAVLGAVLNPENRKDSYIEPYFYPAYKMFSNH